MSRTSKVWMLKKLFEGEPKLSDFELEEHELRDINDGGKNEFFYKKSKIPATSPTTKIYPLSGHACSSVKLNFTKQKSKAL